MADLDVRWQQGLANFRKALAQLHAAVNLAQSRELTDLERQGLIQAFKVTHELAWNIMKDYFAYQGHSDITGARDAIREAFDKGLIAHGEGGMAMIHSRNQTAHAYNEQIATEITQRVVEQYQPLFQTFRARMDELEARQ